MVFYILIVSLGIVFHCLSNPNFFKHLQQVYVSPQTGLKAAYASFTIFAFFHACNFQKLFKSKPVMLILMLYKNVLAASCGGSFVLQIFHSYPCNHGCTPFLNHQAEIFITALKTAGVIKVLFTTLSFRSLLFFLLHLLHSGNAIYLLQIFTNSISLSHLPH